MDEEWAARMDEDREWAELQPEFSSEDCTCDHEPDEHSWVSCEVEDCPCAASWVE